MSKIRQHARGQDCTLRLPGICSRDPAETVLCHLGGAGAGIKRHDYDGLYACAQCHAVMDGRLMLKDRDPDMLRRIYRAKHETNGLQIEAGLL